MPYVQLPLYTWLALAVTSMVLLPLGVKQPPPFDTFLYRTTITICVHSPIPSNSAHPILILTNEDTYPLPVLARRLPQP
jgi:hypothetical protein